MTEIDVIRTNHLVDPHLEIWEWQIPVYLFLGGLTAGVMILSAVLASRPEAERSRAVRWLPFAAPVALSLGMVALFLDLEHKLYVWRFYLALRVTSPMSWGAWILLAIYPATLLLGLGGLTAEEAEQLASHKLLKPLGGAIRWARGLALANAERLRWTNIALGAALGVYTGILLGALGARALWSSALLGPLFLVSGASAGAAFMMLFKVNAAEQHLLRRWDVAVMGLELVLIALFLIALATGSAQSQAAAALLVGGKYTAPFFALVVVGGLAVPLAMELLEARLHLKPVYVAPVLVLAGGLALRWIFVVAGQA